MNPSFFKVMISFCSPMDTWTLECPDPLQSSIRAFMVTGFQLDTQMKLLVNNEALCKCLKGKVLEGWKFWPQLEMLFELCFK